MQTHLDKKLHLEESPPFFLSLANTVMSTWYDCIQLGWDTRSEEGLLELGLGNAIKLKTNYQVHNFVLLQWKTSLFKKLPCQKLEVSFCTPTAGLTIYLIH